MNSKSASFGLFLLGAFALTQVHIVGNIGISELVVFLIAPYVFMVDYRVLKHDGFMPAIWLSILTCIGCTVSSFANHSLVSNFMRGFASPYAIFSILVVGHRLVRRSMGGFKWFCLGLALSSIINIFIFQRGVEADAYAEGARGFAAVEGVMSSSIFWVGRIKNILFIPITGWYMQTPFVYSIVAPIFMFFFAALTTVSGRSAAIGAFGTMMIILLGGKSPSQMRKLSRNFWVLVIIGVVVIQCLTLVYKEAASRGFMGENALKKYEVQMKGRKSGALATLMAGRLEFFVGSYIAFKRPIVGYGPWALDYDGYYSDFLTKYGSAEDYESYLKYYEWQLKNGQSFITLIPAHSHIVGFWVWYGIFGLVFWIYILFQIVRYFRRDLATVPYWYGMLAAMTPSFLWSVFFSPFGDRVGEAMFIVFLLMTKAVRLGRVDLPPEMIHRI